MTPRASETDPLHATGIASTPSSSGGGSQEAEELPLTTLKAIIELDPFIEHHPSYTAMFSVLVKEACKAVVHLTSHSVNQALPVMTKHATLKTRRVG